MTIPFFQHARLQRKTIGNNKPRQTNRQPDTDTLRPLRLTGSSHEVGEVVVPEGALSGTCCSVMRSPATVQDAEAEVEILPLHGPVLGPLLHRQLPGPAIRVTASTERTCVTVQVIARTGRTCVTVQVTASTGRTCVTVRVIASIERTCVTV